MNVQFKDDAGAFVGCPRDAEGFVAHLKDVYESIYVSGVKPPLIHWKESYDPVVKPGAMGDQLKIQRTSSPQANPVFILFADDIGTPVVLPEEMRVELRPWLNRNGWQFVAMVGDDGFEDRDVPPEGSLPLSGTMFELFDAMRTGDETDLRIFDLRGLMSPTARRQWCARLLDTLGKSHALFVPQTVGEFRQEADTLLRQAFGAGKLDPLRDELPGLDALSLNSPLLFGREADLKRLTTRILGSQVSASDAARLTLVTGVSGTGKSSLMRAGLMRDWFRRRPNGPGVMRGVWAVLVEPSALQPDEHSDPLEALGRLLFGTSAGDRAIGPLPGPWCGPVPDLPPVAETLEACLTQALNWWAIIAQPGPLVIIIDQAEQIEAIARRAAAKATQADVEPTALPTSWLRFTAFCAALAGVLDTGALSPALTQRVADLPGNTRLVLSLHRLSALNLWPLQHEVAKSQQVNIDPLSGEVALRNVIQGTCATYGLQLEPDLLQSMLFEATDLANQQQEVLKPVSGMNVPITHSAASVLPQVVVALQRLLTHWRELATELAKNYKQLPSMELGAATYGALSTITGSIEALGNMAWARWRSQFAQSNGIDERGYFEQRQLEQKMQRALGQFLSLVVDAKDADQQDLGYLRREHVTGKDQEQLVAVLQQHRLLISATDDHLRLPHRSILDHWSRAATWVEGARQRLKAKVRARIIAQLEFGADKWRSDEVEQFASLTLNWVGNEDGVNAGLKVYLQRGLVGLLNPETADPVGNTVWDRLPILVLREGHDEWAEQIWDKLLETPISEWRKPALWVGALSLLRETQLLSRLLAKAGSTAHELINVGLVDFDGSHSLQLAVQSGNIEAVRLLLKHGAYATQVHEQSGLFPLLTAAENGHVEAVILLLEHGASAMQVNEKDGLFPLLVAAENGHVEVGRLLLEHGASALQVNEKDGLFPLLMATQSGHVETVKLLLEHGVSALQVNEKDGFSPLLVAAQNGHIETVKLLLEHGADVTQVHEQSGFFPLLIAAQNGHVETVKLLLERGGDVSQVHEQSGFFFPLLMAVSRGHVETVRLLLEHGADVTQVHEKDGVFPLLIAAQNGHLETVKLLLEHGADATQVDEQSGSFPLLMAAQSGCVEAVRLLLLEHGASALQVNKKDGLFPLLLAAQNGHVETVKLLLEHGADASQVNEKDGVFSLLMAAQSGHVETVKLLLEYGVNATQSNEQNGTSSLLMATQNGHVETVKLLLEHGGDATQVHEQSGLFPLLIAAENGYVAAVVLLLEHGASALQVNKKDGLFPLLIAAKNGHVETLKLLLEHGAFAAQVHEQRGSFPLLAAAENGHVEAARLLLERGADAAQVHEQRGSFPLLIAAEDGNVEAVVLLLEHGASAMQVNEKDGHFPLLMAAQSGHVETVKLLLEHGADVTQVHEQNGFFPLLIAAQNGHIETVKLLLKQGADVSQVHEQSGFFPLLMAANRGHVETVRLLLEHEADVKQANEQNGFFSLLIAAQNGHVGTLKLLLEHGADAAQMNEKNGTSSLLMAIIGCQEWLWGTTEAAPTNRREKNEAYQHIHRLTFTEIVNLLIAAGQTIRNLPSDFRSFANALIQFGEAAAEEPSVAPRTEINAAPPSFLADWTLTTDAPETDAGLIAVLSELSERGEEWLLAACRGVFQQNALDKNFIILKAATFESGGGDVVSALELIWLEVAPSHRLPPVVINPGLSLDAVLISLKARGLKPDFRNDDRRSVWAALVGVVSKPPREPLWEGQALPLESNAEIPLDLVRQYSEDYWKLWRVYVGEHGPTVEATWIDGTSLVRQSVLVPDDGLGARWLNDRKVLSSRGRFQATTFARRQSGEWLPYRLARGSK